MKFRPQLERLDVRVLPDASVPAPLNPPDLVPVPDLPPGTLIPPGLDPLKPDKPSQDELQDMLGRFRAILAELECIGPYIDQLNAAMKAAQDYRTWLVLNEDRLIALYGAVGYQAMLDANKKQITDIYNHLNWTVNYYNQLLDEASQLRGKLLQGGIDGQLGPADLQPVIPTLPGYKADPYRPYWIPEPFLA